MERVKSLFSPRRRRQHAIPTLDGAYVPNDRLDELPAIGPVLFRSDDVVAGEHGAVYVSTERTLVRLSGPELREHATVAAFEAPVTALARLSDGSFVVGLNGRGLRHVGADGRVIAKLDRLNGAPLRCVTAIAEHPTSGELYVAIGTTRHDAEDWVWDLMELNRAGLLARWTPGAAEAEVLLDGLAYPYGVQVEGSGNSLLFTESWTHSLSRYWLDGSGRGAATVIDNMPGYPARIAPASGGGHWLAVFAMRTQLIEFVLREPKFRKEMMRTVDPELWVRPALRAAGTYLEPLQGGGIKKLGIRKPWAPPRSYGLVVRLDSHDEPTFSMHSRVDGRNHGVTAAREIEGRLFVVAKGHDRLLVHDLGVAGGAP